MIRSRLVRVACAFAALAVPVALAACAGSPDRGYAFQAIHSGDIQTVAVVIFDNDTLHTGFETTLAEATIKRIQQHTPWRVADADVADAILQGSIDQIRLVAISTQTGPGLVQEQGIRVTTSFEFLDNRRGGTILARDDFTTLATFIPAQPTRERISVGYRSAAETMAIDIVDELGNAW